MFTDKNNINDAGQVVVTISGSSSQDVQKAIDLINEIVQKNTSSFASNQNPYMADRNNFDGKVNTGCAATTAPIDWEAVNARYVCVNFTYYYYSYNMR